MRSTFLIFIFLIGVRATNTNDGGTSVNNASVLAPWLMPRAAALPPGECTKDIPCAVEACCNGQYCGFDDSFCGDAVCKSGCKAKAECGKYADPVGKECPLNVCCGATGACGTIDLFCDPQSVDPTSGPCQSNCEQPGPGNPSPGDVRSTVIGYFESWSLLRRGCANRKISSIRYDSMTHINVAFGYITPKTYDIHPIPGASIAGFNSVTGLKQHAPGLQVWLSLGGWSFSDNDTDTQPVFGDLSSDPDKRFQFYTKLENFMIEWGFDGVDIDWEYPTAPDRRGNPADTQNYVSLLREMRKYFDAIQRGWGISFAAPASYYYLRHFDIAEMIKHVNWVNMMTYDLHGSWDELSNWIGPHVYAHTNLTEIKLALDLLWRNDVPANQVNLGLGFYGRSYTLEDPDCWQPGCVFAEAGIAGTCSGTAGYMSYQDIKYQLDTSDGEVHYDKESAVQYLTYGKDQWVSYDSVDTIKQKVEFANKLGLNGLLIWAIDQDTLDGELLDAVLWPDGLGKFRFQNGAGNDGSSWDTTPLTYCQWSECGTECSGPYRAAVKTRCTQADTYQSLCCPFADVPDPDFCQWRPPKLNGFGVCGASTGCHSDEIALGTNDHYVNPLTNTAEVCQFGGTAYYCCKIEESGDKLCEWAGQCVELDHSPVGAPVKEVCPSGAKTITYRKGNCGGEDYTNSWEPFCCSDKVVDPKCYWEAKSYWEGINFHTCDWSCRSNEIDLGFHDYGGGQGCSTSWNDGIDSHPYDDPRKLCCDRNALNVKLTTLPVKIENLWENVADRVGKDKQKWALTVDDNKNPSESDFSLNPDDHAFGWHIFSGPEDKVANLNARDGSDWELFDCDTTPHEGRQSAKMICMKDSEDHNCGTIWKGQVERTIIEMPQGCGPGKYAIAVSLEAIGGIAENTLHHRLVKRAPVGAVVYNLTFDYGFHVLQGRAEAEEILIRVDYSDDKGYWKEIVAAAPGDPLRKRDDYVEVEEIVKRDHDGDWKRYMDHEWRTERRNTPPDQLHVLHKKWFSQEVEDWIQRQRHVTYETNVLSHGIHDEYIVDLIKVERDCPFDWLPDTVETELGATITATLNIDVDTSALLTLKGDMAHIGDLKTYLTFRNKGTIRASLVFDAWAELQFPQLEKTLFGIAPLGASFKVPGVVTVGPEFKVIAMLEGQMGIHANARVDFHVVSWDYAQTFPLEDDQPIDNDHKDTPEAGTNTGDLKFSWDVDVNGEITAHIIPMMTFGVVFDSSYNLPNAAVDLAIDSWAQLYGSASIGTTTGNEVQWCYGADAGYDLFARVTAPRLFGINLNRRWSLASHSGNIFGDSSGDNSCGN